MVASIIISEWNKEEGKIFLKYGTILVVLKLINFKIFYLKALNLLRLDGAR